MRDERASRSAFGGARYGRAPGVRHSRVRLPLRLGGAGGPVSASGERDALEGENLGEPVKVRVAMEYGEPAVFRCGGGDQRVGWRDAVVAISARGEVAECARRCVGDGAIVAQDP